MAEGKLEKCQGFCKLFRKNAKKNNFKNVQKTRRRRLLLKYEYKLHAQLEPVASFWHISKGQNPPCFWLHFSACKIREALPPLILQVSDLIVPICLIMLMPFEEIRMTKP